MMYEPTRPHGAPDRPVRVRRHLAAAIAVVSFALVLAFSLLEAVAFDPMDPRSLLGSLPQSAQRYPPWSGLLTSDMEDKLFPGARYARFFPITHAASTPRVPRPSELGIEYLFTTDRYHVIGATPVQLYLEVRGRPGIEVHIRGAWAEAQGARGRVGQPVPVTFSGQGSRQVAWFTPEVSMPGHQGMIDLIVEFTLGPAGGGPEEIYQSRLPILYTGEADIPAKFTGHFRHAVVDGWLCMWVGVEVAKPGRYGIDANLFSANGSPGAWVSFGGELPAGWIEVPLPLFGGLIRDAQMMAPFLLRTLRGRLHEGFGVLMRSYEGEFDINVPLDALSRGPWTGEKPPASCGIIS